MKVTSEKKLARSIRLVLATAALVSAMPAGAVLRDHGPDNTTNHFPNWYRDQNGLALGQCLSSDDAGNGPLCLLAGVTAGRFPGNFGPEGFYGTADIIIPVTGGQFTWMNHLEMAYLTADGEPPAIWNANDRQEVVFSRERMLFDVPVTGIPAGEIGSCEGHYTIRTPIKTHEFDLVEGGRSLFYTDDISAIPGNFAAALKGHITTFYTWDEGETPGVPVTAANPAVRIPSGVPGLPDRLYVGDPNLEHLFVGSQILLAPTDTHADKIFQNFVEIIPPTTCDLGTGIQGAPVFNDLAAISGPIWTQAIADPIAITKASYVRNSTSAGIDVWAEAVPNQNVVLTASTDTSQHLPSTTMKEEVVNGAKTGLYHAHLEFAAGETIPAQVTAVNLTSVPASRDASGVSDAVIVTKAEFDPATNALCVIAHSGDETAPGSLSLAAPYNAVPVTPVTCAGVAANDQVLALDLDDLSPNLRFAPESLTVVSSKGGSETVQPTVGTGLSDAAVLPQTAADTFALDGTGTTPLTVLANDGNGTVPTNVRVVVVSQPEVGTVAAPATGPQTGTVSFVAEEGMATGPQTFYYALQNVSTGEVSNVSKVTLNVTQVIPPPVPVADAQGVFRNCGAVGQPACTPISVLANDLTGLTSTAIDPASIQIVSGPARGTATVNPNGTVTYTPVGQGATANNTIDTFTYTVANVAGRRSLTPVTVQVVLKSAAEAIAFQRVRPTWDVRFTSTYAGPAGAVTLNPVATCRLYTNSTAYNNGAGTPIGTIGTALPGAGTNAYQLVGSSPAAPSGNNWVVGCTTSSGGRAARTGQL